METEERGKLSVCIETGRPVARRDRRRVVHMPLRSRFFGLKLKSQPFIKHFERLESKVSASGALKLFVPEIALNHRYDYLV